MTEGYVLGPYWLKYRKKFLKRLLGIQVKIKNHDPDFQLISEKELLEIRRIWRTEEVEEPDWVDSVPKIYFEEIGKGTLLS